MCLWVAPGQEKQETCEESKKEEDTELHGLSLTAFQPTADSSWALYLEPASSPAYVMSPIPRLPLIIVQECELGRQVIRRPYSLFR